MTALKLTPFDSVLIANRGEIACRIIRTAKAKGLKTVAVYSDADANTPHVRLADQAVHIGASPVTESYLDAEKIITAAKLTGASAIHPGYGFLSENAKFAKACKKAGLVFIGPEPDAIDLMGDKAKAKRRMIKAGVPCVPGYQGTDQSDERLLKEAKSIGFPIMVKAAAGGGGRGMRLVTDSKALPDALKDARSEAKNAFGSDVLILERALQKPRHVEIQIFADKYGNTIHLGERDCSVQRRHQKVLEEAPCPVMTLSLRKAMGGAAVKAAKDIGYVGAGTVEFMLDTSGEFFFLEMNTRLQVEHTVTEMVTGLDLVALQLRVARGEVLDLKQSDITLNGHAIEARLYAEDPASDFLPATGHIQLFNPASGDGIRIDSGVETGGDVSPFYDPMIAKVIAHGPTREEARARLMTALSETALFGLKTNKSFLIEAIAHPVFKEGQATTAFIGDNFNADVLQDPVLSSHDAALSAITQYLTSRDAAAAKSLSIPTEMMNWSSATKITTPYKYGNKEVWVTPLRGPNYSVLVGETTYAITVLNRSETSIQLEIDGQRQTALYHISSLDKLDISIDNRTFSLSNAHSVYASLSQTVGVGAIIAPMHGALLDIFVQTGDKVKQGTRLAILEAMKMQHEILAEIDGTVSAIHVKTGAQIAVDTLMIEIEKEEVK